MRLIFQYAMKFACYFLLFIFNSNLYAAAELSGNFIQGGLLFGKVESGTKVTFKDRNIPVTENGEFILGFGRDAELHNELITVSNGKTEKQTIILEKRDYEIQRIDGLPPKKVNPDEKDLVRIKEDVKLVKAARKTVTDHTYFLQKFKWPVVGRISGVYGSQRVLNGEPRRPHYGIDIAAPTGTDVLAPVGGVVTLVHNDMFFSGGTLIVDHGHGLSSTFIHLDKILVQEGDVVAQDDVIAKVGATGRATGPHLDWRMNWFDQRIDPSLLTDPMPKLKTSRESNRSNKVAAK